MTMQSNWRNFLSKESSKYRYPLDDLSRKYNCDRDPKEMLAELWKSKAFKKNSLIEEKRDEKNNVKALEFRQKGNQSHSSKKLKAALEYYNKSIIYSEMDVSPDATHLAFGYGNRSSVLLEMGEYDKALNDIERAFEHGYPDDKKKKLIERQNKCKSALEKNYEAEKSDDPKEEESEHILPSCCLEERSFAKRPPTDRKMKYKHLFNEEDIPIPQLEECNPNVPSLSSAADIGYSEVKGRTVYAKRDIYPGEVISKERSYAFSLYGSYCHTHCTHCGIRTWTPLPCPSCTTVVFCSEECLKDAQESYHGVECSFVSAILNYDPDGDCLLIIRRLIQLPFTTLKEKCRVFEEEIKTKHPSKLGFDEDGVYSSSDFRTIYHLMTNYEKRVSKDILQFCYLSLSIMRLLATETTYLGSKSAPTKHLSKDQLFLARLLFKQFLTFYNGMFGYESIFLSRTQKFKQEKMIYHYSGGVHSLFNHSCDASTILCNYGATTISRAKHFIPTGSEITLSYKPSYVTMSLRERRVFLMHNYYFDCRCEPCLNNWDKAKCPFTLLCPLCKSSTINPREDDGCRKCKVKQFPRPPYCYDFYEGDTISPKDLVALVDFQLKKVDFQFTKNDGDPSLITTKGQLKDLTDAITLLDQYIEKPCGEYKMIDRLKFVFDMCNFHTHERNVVE